jgi:hypothetical protein
MMKHKMGHCRSYPNHAFDAAQYNSFDDMVLVDKVMMMLRLVNLDHCVSKAIKGMLWETQRRYGTHVPVLEDKSIASMGWDGTFVGALAQWLAARDVEIVGGAGLPWRCKGDMCLVDLAPPEKKDTIAVGCSANSVWRCSEAVCGDGRIHCDLVHTGAWRSEHQADEQVAWCEAVQDMVRAWWGEPGGQMERQWQWEAAHVVEHSFLAMALDDGSHTLVQVLRR